MNTIAILLGLPLLAIFIWWFNRKEKKEKGKVELIATPKKWKSFLLENVNFYKNLDEESRARFEVDIQMFLSSIKIAGVQTEVDYKDRLLVAASATIPLFGFPQWTYDHLDEVLLYPSSFDRNFNLGNQEEIITGMVGNGPMEGKMILSKPSLHSGFVIANDKKNVGIHEFVHLFDKESGKINGVPPNYNHEDAALPWLEFIRLKTKEILEKDSDINDYGATNDQEFFAVASEYFFERPHLMQDKHPQLYGYLTKFFNQNPVDVISTESFKKAEAPSRNSLCPCGSGLKYKKCCLN